MNARSRSIAFVVTVGMIVALVGIAAGPAGAAPPVSVDFTVAEDLDPATPGSVVDVSGLPCAAGDPVTTEPTSATDRGNVRRFRGTKDINCAGGILTISYNARVIGCSTTDAGTWRVVGGTGDFDGAKGGGRLVGSYTPAGATNCTPPDGIDDRYTGMIKLSS